MEDEEVRLADELDPILRAMPGFISYKSYRADGGEEIAISRFWSREALESWVHEPTHVAVQKIAHTVTSGSGSRPPRPTAKPRIATADERTAIWRTASSRTDYAAPCLRSFRICFAAFWPGPPVMPPPGCAPEPAR